MNIGGYHLWIKENSIVAINRKNSWKWSEKIVIMPKIAYRFVEDIDTPLVIWIFSEKEENGFEKLKKTLENYFEVTNAVVYIIDEKTFWNIFEKYYLFEKSI